MNSQFGVARLTPEVLTEIKLLEEKIRNQAKENIVLIAYSEHGSAGSEHAVPTQTDENV